MDFEKYPGCSRYNIEDMDSLNKTLQGLGLRHGFIRKVALVTELPGALRLLP